MYCARIRNFFRKARGKIVGACITVKRADLYRGDVYYTHTLRGYRFCWCSISNRCCSIFNRQDDDQARSIRAWLRRVLEKLDFFEAVLFPAVVLFCCRGGLTAADECPPRYIYGFFFFVSYTDSESWFFKIDAYLMYFFFLYFKRKEVSWILKFRNVWVSFGYIACVYLYTTSFT